MDDTSIPELSPEEIRKAAKRAYNSRYYAANREREKTRSKKWRLAHPEHVRAHKQEYRETHPEEYAAYMAGRRAYMRVYNLINRAKIAAKRQTPAFKARKKTHDARSYRKHRLTRRAQHRAFARRYLQTEQGRAKKKANAARRRGHIAAAPINDFTDAQWEALCKVVGYRCCYCGKKFPADKLTPDHLTPYEKQGSNTLHNVLPCCGTCNSRKQHRAVLTPVQPFLLLPPEDASAD